MTHESLAPERTVIAGRYEILALIGAGGMGSVYRARDRKLDEIVALKVLARELADSPGMLERFLQEVKLARKVTHKNVARTYDLGEDGSERFLTMELVDGESLAARLAREHRLSVHDALEIAYAVCEGLAAAHAAGVVHRDLKPDNVLLAKDGRVVITDFGVARAMEKAGQRTMGGPVGTPAYMAPEQVEASPDVDARADQYALGVMLFEMLTGALPFEGPSAYAVAAARLVRDPPSPRSSRPDLPDAIANVIVRCMARRPEDRFTSVTEIATRLGSATLPVTQTLAPAPPRPVLAPTEPGVKTVAVLPLRNLGAPEDAYVAEGLTEDLVDGLSMTPGLRVRARSASAQTNANRDPRDIGRDLDVQVVVEGSARVAGDAVRLSLRLLSVADGFQLWAKRLDVSKSDLLKAADEATSAIAAALTVERKDVPMAIVANSGAVDCYLRGRHEYYKVTPDHVTEAISLFQKGLELSPDDPKMLSWFALSLVRWMNFADPSMIADRFTEAKGAAERAIALAPELPEAIVACAAIELNRGDPARAASLAARALRVAPEHADAHDIAARLLNETGPRESCMLHVERALAREPRLVMLEHVTARWKAMTGDWEGAFAAIDDPPEFLRTFAWIIRARFILWSNDRARAAVELDRVARSDVARKEAIMTMLGVIAAAEVPEAMKQGYLALTNRPGRASVLFAQIGAEMCSFAGDLEAAIEFLGRAVDRGLFDVVWMDLAPSIAPLRALPGFAPLRARVAAVADRVRAPLA